MAVSSRFQLQPVGSCWIDASGFSVRCRSTDNGPDHVLLTFASSDSTCPIEKSGSDGAAEGNHADAATKNVESTASAAVFRELSGKSDTDPLSPLALYTFSIPRWGNVRARPICPGTQVTFSMPINSARYRVDLDLGQVRLENYSPGTKFVFSR
jgi:hypothetical protein